MLAGHPSRYAVKGRGFGVLYIPTDRHAESSLAVTTPFFQAPKCVTDVEINPNLTMAVTAILERHRARNDRIGFVGMDVITAMLFAELAASNPTVRFVEADDLVMNMRAVKSESELAVLRRGSAFADEVGELARDRIRPGITEQEIGSFIVAEMSKRGVANAFTTCQSGVTRSGEPFMFPPVSSRVMEEGDLVHMEINGRLDGYMIDICRSTVVGRGSREAVRLLETVLRMLEKSIAATKPGIMAEELERLANDIAVVAGYEGKFAFGYGGPGTYLGHGIGLGIDEPPVICKGEKTLLRAGMLLTIEPGLYRTPIGGARIEDEVLVTDDGCEVLTKLARRWWA
jgi:Xaa-Pro aminopeptidase